jgi:hypothetical protein
VGQTPAEVERILDDAKRRQEEARPRVVRLPPSAFPGLPVPVIAELDRRRCRIPQFAGPATLNNVIRGEFVRPGQIDWAVLCSVNGTSSILVFWNGSAENPAETEPLPDDVFLWTEDGIQGSPFGRSLLTVGPEYILAHNCIANEPCLSTVPSPLNHQGIDDGIFDKASSIHYFHNGKWLKLAGAD